MEQLIDVITSLGFPMVACVVIYMDSRKDKDRLYTALDTFGDKMDKFDYTLQTINARLEKVEQKID